MRKTAALLLSLILTLGACSPVLTQPSPDLSRISASSSLSATQVAARVSPAVVGIATVLVGASGAMAGLGTGVIVSEDGYILTNHHVAGQASRIDVIFSDGSRARAQTLWSDTALDLAVLKVDGRHQPATLASSADVLVGETVVAIGTPLTLQFQHTVTVGVVSAVNRVLSLPSENGSYAFLEDLIQHDASINPGNSGGPLCNLRGEVVGINTIKVSEAEGIGFAVPVDIARIILAHFIRDGRFEMPYAGIFAVDAAMARFSDETVELPVGLVVMALDPDGPAARAGLAPGDVLVAADGEELYTLLDFKCAQARRKPGETMRMTYERAGKPFTALLTLGA